MLICSAIGDWWDGQLDTLQQVVFILACAASVILVVQFIMLLIGLGDDGGFDSDTDISDGDVVNDDGLDEAGGLRLLSFRTVIAFIAVGCWVAYTVEFFAAAYVSIPVGIVAGAAAAVGVAFAMRALVKLQSDGSRRMGNAVGSVADVYLKIPPARSGSGKIHVVVQESLTECEAVTDSAEALPSGSRCIVKEVINEQLVLVEPFDSPAGSGDKNNKTDREVIEK